MSNELSIGLWGGTASGKTTYLASLYISALLTMGKMGWSITGEDYSSTSWLTDAADELYNGKFKAGTVADNDLSFILSSTEDKFGNITKLSLKAKDLPGYKYQGQMPDELPNYLTTCDGLLLFLSTNTAEWNWKSLHNNIDQIKHAATGHDPADALPHKVAVCFMQYDEPYTLKRLIEKKLIKVKPYRGRDTPFVINPRKSILECIDDGEIIVKLLETKFKKNNLKYFTLSSIGFWNQSDGRVNLNDCSNIGLRGDGVKVIRSGKKISPVHVWTPIAWLAGAPVK
jgi:hypothetical protein